MVYSHPKVVNAGATASLVNYLVLSCSLNPESHSRILALAALERLQQRGAKVSFHDLKESPLPQCDDDACYDHPNTRTLRTHLAAADGILVALPVYNFGVGSAAKNAVEVTGEQAWGDKVVGFLCASGGGRAYMAVMSLANSLMLDFRSVIVPRFVYSTSGDFANGQLANQEIGERVDGLVTELVRFTVALRSNG